MVSSALRVSLFASMMSRALTMMALRSARESWRNDWKAFCAAWARVRASSTVVPGCSKMTSLVEGERVRISFGMVCLLDLVWLCMLGVVKVG